MSKLELFVIAVFLVVVLRSKHVFGVETVNPPCGGGDTLCDCVNIPGQYFGTNDGGGLVTNSIGSLSYNYPLGTFVSLPPNVPVKRVRLTHIEGFFNYSGSSSSTPVRFYIKRALTKVLIGQVNCVGSAPGKYPFSISVDDFERYDTMGIDPVATVSFQVASGCFAVLPTDQYVNALPTMLSTMLYSGLTQVSSSDQWTFSVENVYSADYVKITRAPDIRVCALPDHVSYYLSNWCSTTAPLVSGNYLPDQCGRCQQRTTGPLSPLADDYFPATSQILLSAGMVYGTCVDISGSTAVVSQCPCAKFLPVTDTIPILWEQTSIDNWAASALPNIPPGFGQSVAMSPSFILVGIPLAHPYIDNPFIEEGAAQLFVKTVTPPFSNLYTYHAESIGGEYGHAVTIDEPSEFLAIANPMAVTSLSGGDGEVYIYRTFSTDLLQTLRISDTGLPQSMTYNGFGWRFGESVSMQDGVLAVGISEITLSNITNVGAVAIFRLNTITAMFDFETVLYPTTITTPNQFFGLSVAYQDNYLLVGSRFNEVYLFIDIGMGVWLNIEKPVPPGFPPSPVGEYGKNVDIQLPFFSISDQNSLVSPAARGRVFLFEILSTTDIRMVRVYNDTITSLNTQFGAGMANSDRYLVVGAPLTAPYGAAYIAPIYPPACFDCNGVFNGKGVINLCEECEIPLLNGTLRNSGCLGCDYVPNSGKLFDFCRVCEGHNTTCIVVYPEPAIITLLCDDFGSIQLTHEPVENTVNWTIISHPTQGAATIDLLTGELHYSSNFGASGLDSITVRTMDHYGNVVDTLVLVDILVSCVWCDGSIGPIGPVFDICDVCGGDTTTCVDCDGVFHGTHVPDECGVCNGRSTTCINGTVAENIISDCSTTINIPLTHTPTSTTHLQWSLIAPFATQGTVALYQTARYVTYKANFGAVGTDQIGWRVIDAYGNVDTGVINIELTSSLDCNGVQCGGALPDGCGVCNGHGLTCIGCDGVYASNKFFDVCGVCDGDGSSCVDCFGVPGGHARYDACGICGGNGHTCIAANGPIDDWWKVFYVATFVAIVFSLTFCFIYRSTRVVIHTDQIKNL